MNKKISRSSGNLKDYSKNDPDTNALIAATSPTSAAGEGNAFTINPKGRAIGSTPQQAIATTYGSDQQEDNIR